MGAAPPNQKFQKNTNKQQIPIKGFEQYVDLYIGSKSDTPRAFEQANERWSYAVCLTPSDEFVQVSFVNGICTLKGGRHVEYITNQIHNCCLCQIGRSV